MSDFEQTTDDIEEVSPWTDLWVRPRPTINWIIENQASLATTFILIYLGGVYFGIGRAELKDYGDSMEVGTILTNSIFISGLGGLIIYNVWIWAIDFCAMWFGGKGNFRKTQIAFAWAMLPMAAGLILTLIGYALFEEELFTSQTPSIDSSVFLTVCLWTYGILEVVLGLWHVVLLVVTVSEVQRFSVLKSLASIVSGFLMLILPVIGLLFLIG